MIRLLVAGATGQTGGAAVSAALADPAITYVGGLTADPTEDHHYTSLETAPEADVLIDFTTASFAPQLISAAAEKGIAVVSGTTGLSAQDDTIIAAASQNVPIIRSGNFSLGVNMLLALVEQASAKLDQFDIEITETHHRRKVDAPSGTALMLGEAAAAGRRTSLEQSGVFARHGQTGARKEGEIGFSVLRGGGVPGDHTVSFLAEHETISISHRAMDRRLFAEGAVAAAKWVHEKAPGLYTMRHVLGLD